MIKILSELYNDMEKNKPTYEELEYKIKLLEKEAKWRAQVQKVLKEREEMLRASEEKYRLIFENVFDVIFTFDNKFTLLDVSPSVEMILGYKPEEIIGRPFPTLNILTSESLKAAIGRAIRAFSGESVFPEKYEFIARDGTSRFGELTANPLFKNDKVETVICVVRDITYLWQIS